MFIKKCEYLNLLNTIQESQKQLQKTSTTVNTLNQQIKQQDKQYKSELKKLQECNDKLVYTNQKLIDWIEKIINDVGCYKVDTDTDVLIPVHIQNNTPSLTRIQDCTTVKQVQIPTIRYYTKS